MAFSEIAWLQFVYLIISPSRSAETEMYRCDYRLNDPHHNGIMVGALVCFEVLGVSVLVRRQELTPKLSICSFGGGHVCGKAQRVLET